MRVYKVEEEALCKLRKNSQKFRKNSQIPTYLGNTCLSSQIIFCEREEIIWERSIMRVNENIFHFLLCISQCTSMNFLFAMVRYDSPSHCLSCPDSNQFLLGKLILVLRPVIQPDFQNPSHEFRPIQRPNSILCIRHGTEPN